MFRLSSFYVKTFLFSKFQKKTDKVQTCVNFLTSLELLQQKHVFFAPKCTYQQQGDFWLQLLESFRSNKDTKADEEASEQCHLWPFEKNNGKKLGSKSFANTFQALEEISSRWWFQRFFIFIPTWGNDPIWLKIFQMGWNHQLELNMPKNINFGFSECCIFWWIRTARFYLLLAV